MKIGEDGGTPDRDPYSPIAFYGGRRREPVLHDGMHHVAPLEVEVAEGPGFSPLHYLHIFLKRRWVVIGTFAVCIMAGIGLTLLMTPIYRATTTIKIDRETARVLNTESVQPREATGDEFFQTQYGLLKSRSLAEHVVLDANLADDQQFLTQGGARRSLRPGKKAALPPDRSARIEKAVGLVQLGLRVDPVRTSRLVNVSYDSPNPQVAAKLANAIAESFVKQNLSEKFDQNSYARKFLEDRLEQTRQRLEESERQLVAYEKNQQIIDFSAASSSGGSGKEGGTASGAAQSSLTAANLQAMNSAMVQARSARILAEQRWRQAQASSGMGLPEILQSGAIEQLRQKRIDLTTEYQKNLGTFRPEWPAMVQLDTRIKEVDRQIQAEVDAIKQSLKAQYDLAVQQERTLTGQVEQQKSAFMDLRGRGIQYNILQREVQTNRDQYESLLERSKEVSVAGALDANNISVVDPAQVPGLPFKPRPMFNMMMSAALGLLLGCLLALGLEQLDDSIKSPEDVDSKLDIPLLGAIPILSKGVTARDALADARSAMSEAYYSVRTALQFSTSEGVPSHLLVTSARPSEGKSTTALALAQNFSRLGLRTLLIDSDLRNPSIHKMIGLQNTKGLVNLLTGSAPIGELLQSTGEPNLLFLPCGPLPPNPAELLAGTRLRAILKDLTEEFDQVIIDGPPVMGLADAPLLASAASGTVLVIAAGSTRRGLARAAIRRLQVSQARVLGAVLTKFDAKQSSYGYGYGYGSSYAYSYDYGVTPNDMRLEGPSKWFGRRSAQDR
jgi:polysaccharide biosynthesis transport protein